METFPFTLESGRTVGVTEFGDRTSTDVVVFCHPAPGSSIFDPDPLVTAAHSVRVIALDRAGYGDSGLVDDGPATVDRSAADIAEYLAAEGITSVGAAGWSAGGRIALALAATHPDLVSRVVLIATPAPDDAVPWFGDDNRAMLEQLRGETPANALAALTATFDQFFGAQPTGESRIGDVGTAGVDDSIVKEAHARLVAMLDRAMAHGNLGTAADIISYGILGLGFDIHSIGAPALLLYGASDTLIDHTHASWYLMNLPDAQAAIVPDAGHLVVVPAWGRVLSFLAPGSDPEQVSNPEPADVGSTSDVY